MLKKCILIIVITACALRTYSQVRCGTDRYLHALEQINPTLFNTIAVNRSMQAISVNPNNTIYIPVVVHIIHDGTYSVSNISDAQVISQIAILNQDFGNANNGSGVDTKIQFCLASKDPLGNPTTGITRDQGPKQWYSPFDNYDNLLDDALIKSIQPWPWTSYLNIWVCDIRNYNNLGTLYGYSSFPWDAGIYDGVVINYNYFGTGSNTSDQNFRLGKTATHEVGHWCGLWHTFQDGCANANCSSDGDQVCDTDPQEYPAWADPLINYDPTNCSQRTNCYGNTVTAENYMDYNYDPCLSIFTTGQQQRMHDNLSLYRSYLYNSSIIHPDVLPTQCSSSSTVSGQTTHTTLGLNQGFFINGWIQNQITVCANDHLTLEFSHNDTTVTIPRCLEAIDCAATPDATFWQVLFGNNCVHYIRKFYVSIYYDCDENYGCSNSIAGSWIYVIDDDIAAKNFTVDIGTMFGFNFERGKNYLIKFACDYDCHTWHEQFKRIHIQDADDLIFNNSSLNTSISLPSITNGTYKAIQTITILNSNITSGSNIKMAAGDNIKILPGTLIDSDFHAYIESSQSCTHPHSLTLINDNLENSTTQQSYYQNSNTNKFQENSTQTIKIKENINIYPNPATNEVNLDFNLNNDQTIEMDLYDVNSHLIQHLAGSNIYEKGNNSVNFSCTDIINGVYIIKLNLNNIVTQKKLIILHQ